MSESRDTVKLGDLITLALYVTLYCQCYEALEHLEDELFLFFFPNTNFTLDNLEVH